jgi:hypothetical protein
MSPTLTALFVFVRPGLKKSYKDPIVALLFLLFHRSEIRKRISFAGSQLPSYFALRHVLVSTMLQPGEKMYVMHVVGQLRIRRHTSPSAMRRCRGYLVVHSSSGRGDDVMRGRLSRREWCGWRRKARAVRRVEDRGGRTVG